MGDEYRNYSVAVVQTRRVEVQVQALDAASARAAAEAMALQSDCAAMSTVAEVLASWEANEPEEGPIVADEPGYTWRRGWFWTARLDFHDASLTWPELFPKLPIHAALPAVSLKKAFEHRITGNSTIFDVVRQYGYAHRLDGDRFWSRVETSLSENRRRARRAVKERAERAAEAARLRLLDETRRRMSDAGNANSLFRTKGGRWSVKSVIGDTSNPGAVVLDAGAWSVDIKTVRALIALGHAEVFLAYSTSGDPLAVRLTDAVTRPF